MITPTLGWSVIYAAPPHRCALHRRRPGHLRRSSSSLRSASSPAESSTPLLLIAALCIVAGRVIYAAPPHRCALHRRRRVDPIRPSTVHATTSVPPARRAHADSPAARDP